MSFTTYRFLWNIGPVSAFQSCDTKSIIVTLQYYSRWNWFLIWFHKIDLDSITKSVLICNYSWISNLTVLSERILFESKARISDLNQERERTSQEVGQHCNVVVVNTRIGDLTQDLIGNLTQDLVLQRNGRKLFEGNCNVCCCCSRRWYLPWWYLPWWGPLVALSLSSHLYTSVAESLVVDQT